MGKSPKIVFAGSPEFALPTLQALAKTELCPCLVITMPDSKQGRGKKLTPTPVKILAEKLGIELRASANINENYEELEKIAPDILVTVAYGGYLQAKIRKLPQYGCLNLHPSLLPLYRGANPIKYPLLHGDKTSGYTIFKMVAKMDAGPIYHQEKISIEPNDNFQSLHDKLASHGAKGMISTIREILNGNLEATPQSDALATYTEKTAKEDTYIDWDSSAENIRNFIRAYSPTPGAIAFLGGSPIKILASQLTESKATSAPGTICEIVKNQGFVVATRDSDLLITLVQPAGKKPMPAFDFTLGQKELLHKNFEKSNGSNS